MANPELPSRIRFMLRDVAEQRENNVGGISQNLHHITGLSCLFC